MFGILIRYLDIRNNTLVSIEAIFHHSFPNQTSSGLRERVFY